MWEATWVDERVMVVCFFGIQDIGPPASSVGGVPIYLPGG